MQPLRILAFVFAASLILSEAAEAQHTQGYAFVGGVTIPGETGYTYWHGNFVHVGGGAAAGIGKRFTLGGEIGALISTGERFGRNSGVFSVGPGFHFTPRSERKLDPFVTGGVSLAVAGGAAGMIYYGGGVNYWLQSRIGLRLEFRDHVWARGGTSIHFVGGRIGVSIRPARP